MNSIADEIKRSLSMDSVARLYGFTPNRAGDILCPFHAEKTPSLKIYAEPGRGWHCFGCGQGGSVIDFVMQLFHIPFLAAVVRLNADFALGLTNEKPDRQITQKREAELREATRKREAFEAEYISKADTFRRLWHAKIYKAPAGPLDEPDPEYVEACKRLDALDAWFYEHPFEQR